MVHCIEVFVSRLKVAWQETSLWAKNKLLVSFWATLFVRASTQRFERSRMTWAEIGLDLLIVIACYLAVLVLSFVCNFIFAPARLKREAERESKRRAGQASLNEKLARQQLEITAPAVEILDELMDADEEK